MKIAIIIAIIAGVLILQPANENLSGSFSDSSCTASSTVYSIDNSTNITVSPANNRRAGLILHNMGGFEMLYQLEGDTSVIGSTAHKIASNSSVKYDEDLAHKDTVRVKYSSLGSANLLVIECIY